MSRYIDFDNAFQELNEEPIRIKYKGEEYSIPGSMPAQLPLTLARLLSEGKSEKDFTSDDILNLSRLVIPTDVLDELFKKNISFVELLQLISLVTQEYEKPWVDESGKDQPHKMGHSSSMNTGESSKQTSTVNTESTSQESLEG